MTVEAVGYQGPAERVTGALRLTRGPFAVVHGLGIEDRFIGSDYVERGIEEALWEALRAAGFERIAYCSARDALYFRDDESRQVGTKRSTAPAAEAPARPKGMRFFSGPQGKRNRLGGAAEARSGSAGAPPASAARPRTMTDAFLIQNLDYLMTQDDVRTAVVISRADQFLDFVRDTRALAENFGRWVSRPTANRCLLLFPQREVERVLELVRESRNYRDLAEFLDAGTQRSTSPFGQIGEPEADELARLISLVRLRDGLEIGDWNELPKLIAAAAAQREMGASGWLAELRELARTDTPLTARVLSRRGVMASALPDRTAQERLDELVGLAPVKEHLRSLIRRVAVDQAFREAGHADRSEPPARHLVFTGNPGTGKTTVARLVGEIYRDLGVLRRGQLVAPEVSDLVADYVGGTATNTNRLVDEAMDGVLFIDEAYRLSEQRDGFGQEAINALLSRMEDARDRLVVIAAGYPNEMSTFLDSNPGLRSRIPLANVVEFPDYEPAELLTILHDELGRAGLAVAPSFADQLREVIDGVYRTRQKDFGNARTMREFAQELRNRWADRVLPGDARRPTPEQVAAARAEPLTEDDLPERYRVHLAASVPTIDVVLSELDAMVGLGSVKDTIRRLANRLRLRQRLGGEAPVAPHLLFLGPPGTGKTTVAATIGRILHSLGLLAKGHVVEATRDKLVAGYVGQTEGKTTALIEKALDGVLFIDEAYSLAGRGENDFGRDAINVLVPAMESLRGRLVVVAAGYPEPMREFLAQNEGLASRFTVEVDFPSYTPDELGLILTRMAESSRPAYQVLPEVRTRAELVLARRQQARPRDFGNGRAARGLLVEMEERLAERTLELPEDVDPQQLTTFRPEDVPDA
ncbi:AAA family ATPase [Cryptosporangium sp. NPDC051539]|uniref:AAA family ATPase n=1 Tax=Cryptosporangium sp. NPDC051539 TaxID=3363962 RepID=UPI0037AFFDC6